MQNETFSARNVAKFVVKTAVYVKAKSKTEEVITDYTSFEEDDFVVGIGGSVVGWYISDKLKPYTDKAVDKTADFITAKREARAAKKETKKTEE